MPASWKAYGVDGNNDGLMDPYNPVDAIFAAARYLKAAGADTDIRRRRLRLQPRRLVRRLACCCARRSSAACRPTSSARSPASPRAASRSPPRPPTPTRSPSAACRTRKRATAAVAVERRRTAAGCRSSPTPARRWSRSATRGCPRSACPSGSATSSRSRTPTATRTPTGAWPRSPSSTPRPSRRRWTRPRSSGCWPRRPSRQEAEGRGLGHRPPGRAAPTRSSSSAATKRPSPSIAEPAPTEPPVKARLFANPTRVNAAAAGGAQQEFLRTGRIDGALTPARALGLGARPDRHQAPQGRLAGARRHRARPHRQARPRPSTRTCASRSARPAAAPRAIDPKPILDGWKLLESTAIYRAKGKNPFVGPDAATPTVGQILLMSKETLMQRVLADPRIQIYDCGRQDIQAGAIDRRVLATLEFLVASGFNPTVTSLQLRPLLPDRVGQRLRALDRHRGRHRRDQRHPDPRQPGQGLDHRPRDPAPADPAGHDEAAPDHLADEVRGHRQHARRWPTTTTTSTSASSRSTAPTRSWPSSSTRCSSPSSGRA